MTTNPEAADQEFKRGGEEAVEDHGRTKRRSSAVRVRTGLRAGTNALTQDFSPDLSLGGDP